MIRFNDILYGEIELPDWLGPFLRIPEFVRLRGVRLSNVDSVQFKDFNGPARWEHSIAVASLAYRCATRRGLSERERANLVLAGLLHDVATPPFAHTLEYVLDDFDHEIESHRILEESAGSQDGSIAIFGGQVAQFRDLCKKLPKHQGIVVDPDEVARMVIGQGELGHLICGTLDLDNADNVTRASLYIGLHVDRTIPLALADWLATQDRPPNLDLATNDAVRQWVRYRGELYNQFFTSSEEEMGRQAFLQHLLRRGMRSGLPRKSIIWQTDESLLSTLARFGENGTDSARSLEELVTRYRLLEPTFPLIQLPITDLEVLRLLRVPRVAAWLEDQLSSSRLEPFVIVTARRHGDNQRQLSLFQAPVGILAVFKLGQGISGSQLPEWLRRELPKDISNLPQGVRAKELRRAVESIILSHLPRWIEQKPWLEFNLQRQEDVVTSLEAVGNWSFRLSRNEVLHPYPSTFVHAIPAALINCLGLRGELVVDCFGGTGQTAVEAVKHGCEVVSADSSSVAVMIAQTSLTFLSVTQRARILAIEASDFVSQDLSELPALRDPLKWFHPETLDSLRRIKFLADSEPDPTIRQFLYTAFSAILPQCTARKGKEHAYFADNTPLPKGISSPPHQDAIRLFVGRLRRSISIIERFYASLERDGRNPADELNRARVRQFDARMAAPCDYGIAEKSATGIITSPPYLCTIDYTLGQRLTYAWLFPERLEIDSKAEIGRRRDRFSPTKAVESYFSGLKDFAQRSSMLLRKGGMLAMVLGVPTARRFSEVDVVEKTENLLTDAGYRHIWSHWRPISWQRNYGLEQLKRERVAVYVLED